MTTRLRSAFADHPMSFAEARGAGALRGIVDRIIDGDTMDVLVDVGFGISYYIPVRLLGVLAPEIKGATKAAGERWRAALERLAPPGSPVLVTTFMTARGAETRTFERWVAVVTRADGGALTMATIANET